MAKRRLPTIAARRVVHLVEHRAYMPTVYYVIDDEQLVYIEIAKVACSSIKGALGTKDRGIAPTHSLPRRARSYFTFAFVRNPFDRLVSCYADKILLQAKRKKFHFDTRYNDILIRRLFGTKFEQNMPFGDFVELVGRIPDALSDIHFRSQASMLHRGSRMVPDYVGKFESLGEDWEEIAVPRGLPLLGHVNPSARADWESYYRDANVLDAVANRYARDIEAFDYGPAYDRLRSGQLDAVAS